MTSAIDPSSARAYWNGARWPRTGGHYESWFQRANHPTRPLGFWIRYTIFAPADPTQAAQGELWAIWFDGEREQITVAKSEHPIAGCRFDREALGVEIAGAVLDGQRLVGSCEGAGHHLGWRLDYDSEQPPLLLLPEPTYARGFPKAKAVVGSPLCRFRGSLEVDGQTHAIDRWLGTQNHNWGPRHTDRYAWGQVAGFDGRDDVLLECMTAKLRIGPLWTPWLTIAVMRVGGQTLNFNAMGRTPFGRPRVEGLRWRFDTGNGHDRLRAEFSGEAASFVGLRYRNPPGGTKICLNSKIASCRVELDRPGAETLVLHGTRRAAFELLGEDSLGIPVVA